MRFPLREFEQADFDRLYEIDQVCFPPGIAYSRRELEYYMNRRGAFTLVAETVAGKEKTPEIAGFIVVEKVRQQAGPKKSRGLGHIITIDTVEKFRRHGLGSLLMRDAEDRLQSLECHGVVLEAAVDNAAAIAFYKRLGYVVLKTIPRYYQGRLDALMMIKRLAAKSVSA
ncbi:MAG: GNAT family N-acetyltransferase [Bryobacteraceae bacterium]